MPESRRPERSPRRLSLGCRPRFPGEAQLIAYHSWSRQLMLVPRANMPFRYAAQSDHRTERRFAIVFCRPRMRQVQLRIRSTLAASADVAAGNPDVPARNAASVVRIHTSRFWRLGPEQASATADCRGRATNHETWRTAFHRTLSSALNEVGSRSRFTELDIITAKSSSPEHR
jgi:hypothetical protein